MLNQFVVVGRVETILCRKDNTKILLRVAQNYQYKKKEIEYDYVEITCYKNFFDELENVEIGSLVGIKGKIGTDNLLICEKLTYLNKKVEEKEEGEK